MSATTERSPYTRAWLENVMSRPASQMQGQEAAPRRCCATCKHAKAISGEEPCRGCLQAPTHVNWEPKE